MDEINIGTDKSINQTNEQTKTMFNLSPVPDLRNCIAG